MAGFYGEHVLPRILDVTLGKGCEDTRARVCADLSGEVVEVGFGSGRNVAHYPSTVTRVHAVEPASGGNRLAARRIAASAVPVSTVGLDGQALPLGDESVDHALVTWTLCTIPNAGLALREIHRVLRPGGVLHFVEHGRSPSPRVANWQERLTPLWAKALGGCQLNRCPPELLTASGFALQHLDTYPMRGPEFAGYTYEGTATKRYRPR